MKQVDRQAEFGQIYRNVVQEQIKEVNLQSEMLNQKIKNFKNTAQYLIETRAELEKMQDDLKKEVDQVSKSCHTMKERAEALNKEAEVINSQISSSDLKLKVHKDKDDAIISQGDTLIKALNDLSLNKTPSQK